jgi:hypothetical protein
MDFRHLPHSEGTGGYVLSQASCPPRVFPSRLYCDFPSHGLLRVLHLTTARKLIISGGWRLQKPGDGCSPDRGARARGQSDYVAPLPNAALMPDQRNPRKFAIVRGRRTSPGGARSERRLTRPNVPGGVAALDAASPPPCRSAAGSRRHPAMRNEPRAEAHRAAKNVRHTLPRHIVYGAITSR